MPTYLLNNDDNYLKLLFYILNGLNAEIYYGLNAKILREIYDSLLMYEIIEEITIGWTELNIFLINKTKI